MKKKKTHFLILIVAFICTFMSIGYAAISNITLEIDGTASIPTYHGVLITNASITSSPSSSLINTYSGTMVNTSIVLADNVNATETVQITILNNSSDNLYFDNVVYDNNYYSNNNIDYTLTGLSHGQALTSGNSVTFTMTFKYTDAYKASNPQTFDHSLNAYLNFHFKDGYPITYTNISGSGYPAVVLDGENLVVNFGANAPYDIDVVGLDTSTTYIKGTDFTYSNGILTFNGVDEALEVTGVSGGGGQGIPSNPYIDSVTTVYDPNSVPPNSTIKYTNITGEPQVTTDQYGNIISFEYTNPGQNGFTSPSGGVDTGVLAFDGTDFVVTLHTKLNYDTKSLNPIIVLSSKVNGATEGIVLFNSKNKQKYIKVDGTVVNAKTDVDRFRMIEYDNGQLNTTTSRNLVYKNKAQSENNTLGWTSADSPLEVTIKLYNTNNMISAEVYNSSNTLIGHLASGYEFDFTNGNLGDISVVLGHWVNNNDVVYDYQFPILGFSVVKSSYVYY